MVVEEWRGTHNPNYDVSNLGRVRSHFGSKSKPLRILKCPLDTRGYHKLRMWENGEPAVNWSWVHILVAAAFHGPRPEKHQVRHKDGTRTNNRATNLEYGTGSENMQDAVRHRSLHMLKLTVSQVRQIRQRWGCGERQVDLGREYGVAQGTISAITTGRKWSYV